MEFLISISLVLIIFMIMGIVIYQKYVGVTDTKIDIAGRHTADTIAENINEISSVGNGYSQFFTLPGEIYGDSYTVEFYKNEPAVFVKSGMTWSSPLFTTNITCLMSICETSGDITRINLNSTKKVRISNHEGVVYLEDSI